MPRVEVFNANTVVGENTTAFFTNGTLLEIVAPTFIPPDYLEVTAFMRVYTSPTTTRLLPLYSAEDSMEVINVTSTLLAIPLPVLHTDTYNCDIVFQFDIAVPFEAYVTTKRFCSADDLAQINAKLDVITLDQRNNNLIPLAAISNLFLPPGVTQLILNAVTILDILDNFLISNPGTSPIGIALDRAATATDYDYLLNPGDTVNVPFAVDSVFAYNFGIDPINVVLQAFD